MCLYLQQLAERRPQNRLAELIDRNSVNELFTYWLKRGVDPRDHTHIQCHLQRQWQVIINLIQTISGFVGCLLTDSFFD